MKLFNVVTTRRGRNSTYFLNVRGHKTQVFGNKKDLAKAITAIKKAA